uniref:Uncharacterized protein n=1 Tax=Strigamia maritima TaxID=126957 RepID=T1J233_STRMM
MYVTFTSIVDNRWNPKWLAAGNSSWSETDEQGQRFIEGSGKNIFVTASRRRKILLRSGIVDLWDLQLLSTVLLKFNFGNGANLTKQEKKAIASLAVIHSDFRKSSTGINREEFDVAWEKISQILVKLGDSSDELKLLKLDKLKSMEMDKHSVSSAGDTRSESLTLQLRKLGNKFFQEHNFIEAISAYTQDIPIQRCKIQSALLYSNRSAAYRALPNDILFYKQKMEKAKDDIKNAMELCPTWYKAHYRMGCFYEEINNNKKAAKHLEFALILDPSKIEISNKLDKVKSFIKSPDSDVNVKLSMEDFISGGSHWTVWKGYCYLYGIQVEKNYKLAAELFAEAVNDNNAFALTKLAHMYLLGLGVKKNKKMHFQLLLKAASLPHIQMNGQINNHVINAKCFLGLAYYKGLGVFPDLEKAFVWFKKATDNGCPNSPFDLGNLYLKGTGVEKDDEKAVYYWQLAADRGLVEACYVLADYYLSQDPDKALLWHRRFMTESKIPEKSKDSIFEVNEANLRQRVDIRRICEWEAENGVSIKGLSLGDRRKRFVNENTPNFDEYERKCLAIGKKHLEENRMETITKDLITDDIHYPYPFKLNMLKEFTSATSKRIQQAVIHFSKAIRYLKASEFHIMINFVIELSNCLKIEPLVVHWHENDRSIAASIVLIADLMGSHLVNSYFEVQMSICYVYFHHTSFARMKKLLKTNIEKYPEEFYFYSMFLSNLLAVEDYEEGVKEAELALNKFPNNCELLLYRAKHVRGLEKNTSRIIKAYEDFLSVAEPDHPEVPAAYYEIAFAYSNLKMLNQCFVNSDVKVKDYYHKGLEAEKSQLPCFLPYKRSDCFEVLSKIVSGMKCEAENSNSEEDLMSKLPLVNVTAAIDNTVSKPVLNVCTAEEILSKAKEKYLEKNVPVAKHREKGEENGKECKQNARIEMQFSKIYENEDKDISTAAKHKDGDVVIAAKHKDEDVSIAAKHEDENVSIAAKHKDVNVSIAAKHEDEDISTTAKQESGDISIAAKHKNEDVSIAAKHEDEDVSIAAKHEDENVSIAAKQEDKDIKNKDISIAAKHKDEDVSITTEPEDEDVSITTEPEDEDVSTTTEPEDEDVNTASKHEDVCTAGKLENEVHVAGEIETNLPFLHLTCDDKIENESENGGFNADEKEIINPVIGLVEILTQEFKFVDLNNEAKMIEILPSQKELELVSIPQNVDKNTVNQGENDDQLNDLKISKTVRYRNATFEILSSAVQIQNENESKAESVQINCDKISDFSAAGKNYLEKKEEFVENSCSRGNASCSLVVLPRQAPANILIEENFTVLEILLGIRDPYTLYSNVRDFLSNHLPQLGIYCFEKLATFSIGAVAYLSASDDLRTSQAEVKTKTTFSDVSTQTVFTGEISCSNVYHR